jgi:hypothetical protein
MKKTQAYRHGEIGFIKIDSLPENLTKSDSKVIMQGSHGNSHSFDNGEIFFKNVDQYIFGYFVAKNTTLYHNDHGKEVVKGKPRTAKLPNGIYELRKQNEVINNELKPVID